MEDAKRPRGRPAIAPEDRLVVVPIRLRQETVAALDKMSGEKGATTIAREIIERAVKWQAARKIVGKKSRT